MLWWLVITQHRRSKTTSRRAAVCLPLLFLQENLQKIPKSHQIGSERREKSASFYQCPPSQKCTSASSKLSFMIDLIKIYHQAGDLFCSFHVLWSANKHHNWVNGSKIPLRAFFFMLIQEKVLFKYVTTDAGDRNGKGVKHNLQCVAAKKKPREG